MNMPERKFDVGSGYRYGFNGKEKDKETSGTSTYDYGFRIYNPALSRFLSVDPLSREYPWNSSFAFAENSPIEFIDLDGLEKFKISMNLFIPFKTVPVAPAPPPIPGAITVKGDNRNLDASGTNPHNRVSISFIVDLSNPQATQFQTNISIGETKYYLEMPFSPDMTIWSGRAELGKEVNANFTRSVTVNEKETVTTINYSFECLIPFPFRDVPLLDGVNPAPAIDGSGTFIFIKNKQTGEVKFNQTHNVDGFPANEYVAQNLDNNTITPLLLFQPDDKTDAINLLPLVGDKTFESKNKTLVSGNNGKPIWAGAVKIMENNTTPPAAPPAAPVQNKSIPVDKKPN